VFEDILEKENTIVENKNNKLLKSINWDFFKEVIP